MNCQWCQGNIFRYEKDLVKRKYVRYCIKCGRSEDNKHEEKVRLLQALHGLSGVDVGGGSIPGHPGFKRPNYSRGKKEKKNEFMLEV